MAKKRLGSAILRESHSKAVVQMKTGESCSLRIGFDIDGTATKYPEFFSLLSRLTRENNGKVYVISSRSNNREVMEKTRKELQVVEDIE